MEDQIILQHDQQSASKLPARSYQAAEAISGFDLRVMNRYLTLLRKRIAPNQAEEIICVEFGITEDRLTQILRTETNEQYVATSVEKLTPTKENLMFLAISSLQDIVSFNVADCYTGNGPQLKRIADMPLAAQMAIKSYGYDADGRPSITFHNRLDAIKTLAQMHKSGLLDSASKSLKSDDSSKVGMFDYLLQAEPATDPATAQQDYPELDFDDPPEPEEWS